MTNGPAIASIFNMAALKRILDALAAKLLEVEALLMAIRVIQYDVSQAWLGQFVAMSGVGLLIGAVLGWMSIVHILVR